MTRRKKEVELPQGACAIGLTQEQAAGVWGISPTLFARLEKENSDLIPPARRVGNRKLYSRVELEQKFHALPYWDEPENDDDEWRVS
jgi:hypothetical protein